MNNTEIEMKWINYWNDLDDYINLSESNLVVYKNSEFSVDEAEGKIQDAVYENPYCEITFKTEFWKSKKTVFLYIQQLSLVSFLKEGTFFKNYSTGKKEEIIKNTIETYDSNGSKIYTHRLSEFDAHFSFIEDKYIEVIEIDENHDDLIIQNYKYFSKKYKSSIKEIYYNADEKAVILASLVSLHFSSILIKVCQPSEANRKLIQCSMKKK